MDFFGDQDDNFGEGTGRELLNAARAQSLRFSNFLLTISTNVVPQNLDEEIELTGWLLDVLGALFGDFSKLNGWVLKPAGTRNEALAKFPARNKIMGVRSKISIERGNTDKQRGQVHAHVLLEVAHEYLDQRDGAVGVGGYMGKPNLGVHINVYAMREYLNHKIQDMGIDDGRKPKKIYVNSKLLTKGTDNSNKWLTLQYIDKDIARDNGGGYRDLRQDEGEAPAEMSEIREHMLNPQEDIAVVREDIVEAGAERTPSPPSFTRTTVPAPNFVRTTAFRGTTQPPKFKTTSYKK